MSTRRVDNIWDSNLDLSDIKDFVRKYNHSKIEKKWQEKWEEDGIFRAVENLDKEKRYILDMFPYPSGAGLHVGHPKGYIATDILSRYYRMNGRSVLHPMGWDAFGLPAENYALKTKTHPRVSVEENVKTFKEQLSIIGFDYDWSREINTTDPEFYKWTQWTFIQMFKKGLAHQSNEPINWCPSCKTGLAQEDLEGGRCERCGSEVEKKPLPQWVLKITNYADRLLEGLNDLNWPKSIKESQKNWIGRKEGSLISFEILFSRDSASSPHDSATLTNVSVFTTRPDTLFGATYLVLAPEHSWLDQEIKKPNSKVQNKGEVEDYIKKATSKTDIERTSEGKEKTGVRLEGISAINPGSGEEIPVFVADYVLVHYGTGAIMAVPAHDERDFEFAIRYNLPIKQVISAQKDPVKSEDNGANAEGDAERRRKNNREMEVYTEEGILINSGKFDGLSSDEAKEKITEAVGGEEKTTYKLRDWVFSRQRYWGEPIPIIHCESCGPVAVPEKDLPVLLPKVESYEPSGTGESPLANISEWVNTNCPKCGGSGKRETNTMPQWAGSSWYYLRYMDPNNDKNLVSKEREKYWSPVDIYVGGAEHATRHLIYARFWHKFLYDIGAVTSKEPFQRLQHVGLILAEDGRKMSKRYDNVINPDDIVERFGADTLRMYEMFMGPFDQNVAWSEDGLMGPRRFLEKVWRGFENVKERKISQGEESLIHRAIKKVGEDIEEMKFNTAISAMMTFWNKVSEEESVSREAYKTLLLLLAPFAPHMTEELWQKLGEDESIHLTLWPAYDKNKISTDTYLIVVQINGKTRDTFKTKETEEEDVREEALKVGKIKEMLQDKDIEKVIYVPKKLINIVTKDAK